MSAVVPTAGWHAGFISILPAIETHVKIRFRRFPACRREDAVQEAIATACMNYQLLVAGGRFEVAHASTLADFAVRHVRAGRRIGGKQDGAKDAMSPVCQRRHGIMIVGDRDGGWSEIAVEGRKMPVPDLAAFRIDFATWLRSLSLRDRKMIGALVRGERTSVVADRFGISAGRVSQLRRRYEREWHLFQGETA